VATLNAATACRSVSPHRLVEVVAISAKARFFHQRSHFVGGDAEQVSAVNVLPPVNRGEPDPQLQRCGHAAADVEGASRRRIVPAMSFSSVSCRRRSRR
jgi:hypothetical protein